MLNQIPAHFIFYISHNFIQVRNPMKKCLNSTKTLEKNNCKIYIFLFFVCKNSKATKQNKYSKMENRKQQQNRNNIQIQKTDRTKYNK